MMSSQSERRIQISHLTGEVLPLTSEERLRSQFPNEAALEEWKLKIQSESGGRLIESLRGCLQATGKQLTTREVL
jgi:hypothetical protein